MEWGRPPLRAPRPAAMHVAAWVAGTVGQAAATGAAAAGQALAAVSTVASQAGTLAVQSLRGGEVEAGARVILCYPDPVFEVRPRGHWDGARSEHQTWTHGAAWLLQCSPVQAKGV